MDSSSKPKPKIKPSEAKQYLTKRYQRDSEEKRAELEKERKEKEKDVERRLEIV